MWVLFKSKERWEDTLIQFVALTIPSNLLLGGEKTGTTRK